MGLPVLDNRVAIQGPGSLPQPVFVCIGRVIQEYLFHEVSGGEKHDCVSEIVARQGHFPVLTVGRDLPDRLLGERARTLVKKNFQCGSFLVGRVEA
jgi:hypothetical protein